MHSWVIPIPSRIATGKIGDECARIVLKGGKLPDPAKDVGSPELAPVASESPGDAPSKPCKPRVPRGHLHCLDSQTVRSPSKNLLIPQLFRALGSLGSLGL